MPSGKDVQMQVADGLTAVRSLVDNDAIALPVPLKAAAEVGGGRKQLGFELGCGFRIEFREMFGVQGRDDQDVRRGLRMQIVKRDDVGVAQHFPRRYLAADDLTKDAVLRVAHVFGFINSKSITPSGFGMTPATFDFIANGTVVCTSGIAGASS